MLKMERFAFTFLFLACYVTTVKSNADIVKCFLCNLLTEETEHPIQTPSVLYAEMYKRCGQLGLIQSICDSLVDQYAKTIVRLRRSKAHFTQKDICLKLRLCDY